MKIFRQDWVIQGSTTVSDGDAKSEEVRNRLLKELKLPVNRLVLCRQVHGDQIAIVRDDEEKIYTEKDGLVTDMAEIVLGIFTADCVPVFVKEPSRKIIGLFHAGWRGTLKGIIQNGIEAIRNNWKVAPSQLRIDLGPRIQPCCYKVGADVADHFSPDCRRTNQNGIFLDLGKAIMRQIRMSGVPEENISASPECTCCGAGFFSYRRDKTEERMLSFIVKL